MAEVRPLTLRQQRILRVIREKVRERGYPPSLREIGDGAGLKSTSAVYCQLRTLQRRGAIRRVPGLPRAVEIVEPLPSPPEGHSEDDAQRRIAEIRSRPPINGDTEWLLGEIEWLNKQIKALRGDG